MLFPVFLLIFTEAHYVSSQNVGSVLFYNKNIKECWSEEEVAKLRARRILEDIVLPPVTPEKIDHNYIKEVLRYYRKALQAVNSPSDYDQKTSKILKQALADTLGGHFKCELLPTVRFAYYAGYIPFATARQVQNFYMDLKNTLNTQGIGWGETSRVPQWANLTVAKVLIGASKLSDPCARLITRRDSKECIHLPYPKLDNPKEPAAIALPFKRGGLVSLTSPEAENIMIKYYTTAARCILTKSPEQCRHTDFLNFNNELWHWMKREVAPHLTDDKLYAAYGGILRIAAAVQNYGKGLSRRNLFEEQDEDACDFDKPKKTPWDYLAHSTVYINAEWTPKLYVFVVIMICIIICMLQLCFGYCCGKNVCTCHQSRYFYHTATAPDLYPTMDSNPQATEEDFLNHIKEERTETRTKSTAVGTPQAEIVYDLNENTEQLMPVIMSDYEGSQPDSDLSSRVTDDEGFENTVVEMRRSPPKIDPSISQLRIQRQATSPREGRGPMYSTSTVTRSTVTYRPEEGGAGRGEGEEGSDWSGSLSSSTRSGSSASSKSGRRSRSSRDLAWARRVISQSRLSQTPNSITTKVDSYTTTSQR